MNIAKIDGTEISSEEFVSWLKLSGRFAHVAQDLIKVKLCATAAQQQGIGVSDAELQEAADNHRRLQGLHRVKDTNEFLESAHTSLDAYENYIKEALLAVKLEDQIANDEAIDEYFKLNAPQFEAVELGHIVVDSEGKAKEIQYMVNEDPECFAELAQEQSLVESADEGGRIGRIYRGALNPELEAKLFSANLNEAIGPFNQTEDRYEIFMVFSKHEAVLDAGTKDIIRRQLIDAWLDSAVRDYAVEA